MNIEIESINPCRKKLTVEIPAVEAGRQFASSLGEYARTAQIKGFRPGRAPIDLVKARYGKQIRQDTADRLVQTGYRAALKQESLNPVAILDISDAEYQPDEPFSFTITCDVAPEFEMPAYTGIEVENRIRPVADEDIESTITELREQFVTFEASDRPAEAGDLVQVDFEGTIDGVPVIEVDPEARGLGQAEDFWVMAGEGAFLPEFGEALLGATPGPEREITVQFADDFQAKGLQGRQALYRVKVKEVRRKIPGELNEEQLKPFGVSTLDELRRRIADDLERRNERLMQQDFRNQVITHLLTHTVLDLPESVVQDETRSTVYELVESVTRGGMTPEQIQENKLDILNHASRTAADKVKIRYVLAAIAEKEKVEVSDGELDDRIQKMSERLQARPEQVRATLAKNGRLEDLREDLRREKTLDFLMEQATVKGA